MIFSFSSTEIFRSLYLTVSGWGAYLFFYISNNIEFEPLNIKTTFSEAVINIKESRLIFLLVVFNYRIEFVPLIFRIIITAILYYHIKSKITTFMFSAPTCLPPIVFGYWNKIRSFKYALRMYLHFISKHH